MSSDWKEIIGIITASGIISSGATLLAMCLSNRHTKKMVEIQAEIAQKQWQKELRIKKIEEVATRFQKYYFAICGQAKFCIDTIENNRFELIGRNINSFDPQYDDEAFNESSYSVVSVKCYFDDLTPLVSDFFNFAEKMICLLNDCQKMATAKEDLKETVEKLKLNISNFEKANIKLLNGFRIHFEQVMPFEKVEGLLDAINTRHGPFAK